MFGTYDGCDSICVCHWFKVGVFFYFGAISISIAGLDLTLILLFKLLFKIVVIVTVSFLNFFLPLNIVSLWYHDSLYARSGLHMVRIHCLMAMFATKDVLWIPPSNSFSKPRKTMDLRVRRVQNAIQGL